MEDYRAMFEKYYTYTTEKLERMRANRVADLETSKEEVYRDLTFFHDMPHLLKPTERAYMDLGAKILFDLNLEIEIIDMVLASR